MSAWRGRPNRSGRFVEVGPSPFVGGRFSVSVGSEEQRSGVTLTLEELHELRRVLGRAVLPSPRKEEAP